VTNWIDRLQFLEIRMHTPMALEFLLKVVQYVNFVKGDIALPIA